MTNLKLNELKTFISKQSTDDAIALVSNHPQVLDEIDENKTSGYLVIAYSGNQKLFEVAKKFKTDFNLAEAILAGNMQIVEEKISSDPAQINQFADDGFSPVALATYFGQIEIARFLLMNGADPGLCASNPSKVNALHAAVAKQNLALCELFISKGVNVNTPQAQNISPLHSAAHRGNLQLVRLLVENGADVNFKSDEGKTAIDFARIDRHQAVVDYLSQITDN